MSLLSTRGFAATLSVRHGTGKRWPGSTQSSARSSPERVMDIEEEVRARVRAAKAWDKDAKLEDFQIKATENGYVLINLKTRRAQLIYDDQSELHDWARLFPDGFGEQP